MPRCPSALARLAGALGAATLPLTAVAHDEWNLLHITNASRAEYVYPFDGRTPKVGVALLNHHEIRSPEIVTALDVNGQRQEPGGPFLAFPHGSTLSVSPDGFHFALALTGGIYDGRAGPAPVPGETKTCTFTFTFQLAPGAVAPPGQVPPPGPTYVETVRAQFIHLGDNPPITGPLPLSGVARTAAAAGLAPAANARVEVATPYSNWFPLGVSSAASAGGATHTFGQSLLARADWHVRLSADGFESKLLPLGHPNDPHPPLDVTLEPARPLDLDYRRSTAIATPTGFWRGAVSESEGTFVAFPGQETWRAVASDAEARALRTASRIVKLRFDGTPVWEHAPGWETWAGDMSADGRFVAYALNPTALSFFTPAEHKLVLLDGATGTVLWTRAGAPGDAAVGRKVDALELTFSPDARWIAVGSVAAGTVTLVDRATGNFAWTVPGPGTPSFGQVRRLRFSPDGQFLYCGSGDSHVRQLRVSDGTVLWKAYAGGWPYLNGLDLTPDGSWLAAGTRSLDVTLIRTSDGQVRWQRESQQVDAVFAPDGRHVVTAGGQVYRTIDGELAGMTKTDAVARFTPDGAHVLQFGADVRLYDLGGKLLRAFEASGLGARPHWAHLTADGRHAILLARDLTAAGQTGIAIYERRPATAPASPPVVTLQPLAQVAALGQPAALSVTATGRGPLGYQWRRNGTPLPGAQSATLRLRTAGTADAGTYTCVVTNAAGATTSAPAALEVVAPTPADPARLANLAVRTHVAGATPLIVGFALGGAGTGGTKPLLIRGAGPALAPLGVTGALADPSIELFSGAASVLANDNWGNAAAVAALGTQLGAFAFAPSSRDAALVASAVGGSYTALLASADGSTGTALAEIYDGSVAFGASTPRLTNLSARTELAAAGDTLIAGFVVAGATAKLVLVRGIGPGLAGFGVRNALANPELALFRGTTRVAQNDNWHEAPAAVAINEAATAVGAFPLAPASGDAALLLSLPPGSYTAQVTGTGPGVALVEVYDVP